MRGFVRSALQEGGEEITQYSVENLINKVVGSNTAKTFSLDKNEEAIINPLAQLEQGAYGTAIGGILGGGQRIAGSMAEGYYKKKIDAIEQARKQPKQSHRNRFLCRQRSYSY